MEAIGTPEPDGVYFVSGDYAGLGRRLVIIVLDSIVLLIVLILTLVSYELAETRTEPMVHGHTAAYIAFVMLYLVFVARTRVGTLGYALTGVRIVDLRGEVPSVGRMLYRALFAAAGPLNAFFDVIFLGGDPHRQALRDKVAGTYLIRRRARPAGRGPQRRVFISVLGYTLMVREVVRDVT